RRHRGADAHHRSRREWRRPGQRVEMRAAMARRRARSHPPHSASPGRGLQRHHHAEERVMAQEYDGAFDEIQDDPSKTTGNGQQVPNIPLLSQETFLKGFVAPSYLVDGVIQRGFIYALTGRTGHAKTAIALALTRAVGSEDPNAKFGGHQVEKGRVLYFVG